MGDSLAAIAYGAPLHVSGGYPPDLYVPDKATLRRAMQLLGTSATHQQRAATLRVAPMSFVCSKRIDGSMYADTKGLWLTRCSSHSTSRKTRTEAPRFSPHGIRRSGGNVSGSADDVATVELLGPALTAIVQAIPVIARETGRPRSWSEASQSYAGCLAHIGPRRTATPVTLVTDDPPSVLALVARPAALVAMKLQSVMNRGAAKEGTDLLDIVRISTDPLTTDLVAAELPLAHQQLKEDALLHTGRWFKQASVRTLKLIRNIPEGVATTTDDLDLVAELLIAALTI